MGMAQPEREPLWTATPPHAWPVAPAEMTVTTLSEIEACPRRWALGAADYPALWSGRGYPSRIRVSALAGAIVHFAVEEITKALARAGCGSVENASALHVMRGLGGYTKVLNSCIDRVLARIVENPRAKPVLGFVAPSLRAQIPEFRTRVQTMLSRVHLPERATSHADSHVSNSRARLTSGVFPEIELRARRIGWKGKPDLLVLTPESCEITDFKTGEPDDAHRFQIQVYALLWSRDAQLNPDARLVGRLVLAYSGGDVEVAAPTAADLDALESQIIARRDAARQAVSHHPPAARPDTRQCRYCGVRQLCDVYWMPETQKRLAAETDGARFTDIEATVIGRHGPSSWDVQVGLSRDLPAGTAAVLRTRGDVNFRVNDRLRILDAAVTLRGDDETQPAVITVGTLGETYAIA